MDRPELEFDRSNPADTAGAPSPQKPVGNPRRVAVQPGQAQTAPARGASPPMGSARFGGSGVAGAGREQKAPAAGSGIGLDTTHLQLASALEKVRSELLDQTPQNRLLSYRELSRDVPVVDCAPDQVYQHMVEDGGVFYLEPSVEAAGEPDEPAASTLGSR